MADQSTPMIFQNGSIVGIGTGSPSIGKLHVEGTAYASLDLQAGTDIRMLRTGVSPAFVISNNTDLRWVNSSGGTITMTIGSGSVNWGGVLSSTSSQFNPYSSAGTAASPVFQDAILLGPTANVAKIQFGNEFQSTHGSYIRFQTNSASAQNTPTTALTLYPSGAGVFSSTLTVNSTMTVGGTLYIPGGGQIVINNEASTWAYINRTSTPSTTFLGSQLKNIISCGGGVNEGFAVGGVGQGYDYSAFEVRNSGAGYFRSSLSVGTTATTFTGEFATSLRVGGGTYASTSCRVHFYASTQYGQIIEHNPGSGSTSDAYDTIFLVNTYDDPNAKATVAFSCNSAGQHHRAIIQAYRDQSGGSGASGRMDIKMRDNSAGYSTAIGIRSSLTTAFFNSITSTGDITAYSSDARLKENVSLIENALDKVSKIRGVSFSWKPEAEKLGLRTLRKDEVGVLAQEIQAVLPEAVFLAPFDQSDEDPQVSKTGENYLTVKYEKIVPLLIEAVKELAEQNKKLEEKNREFETLFDSLINRQK